jgi:uncharacterized glyoxalase superfamily protein PhnB
METKLNASGLTASLTVKDIEASTAWYTDLVGFEIDRKIEREGKLVAIALRAGAVRMMLNQDDGAKGWDRPKGEGISLMITTSDVDGVADRIKQKGGVLATAPADMPWGARAFRVVDPDGFKVAISTPVGG